MAKNVLFSFNPENKTMDNWKGLVVHSKEATEKETGKCPVQLILLE